MTKRKYHKIPFVVLDAYQYIGKNWNERSYINAISKIPNGVSISDAWFFNLQKLYGIEITPKVVYLSSYKQGLLSYTPAVCKNCGKLLNIDQALNKRSYCSWKCANSSEESINKIKKTLLKHYGVDSPIKSAVIRERMKKTSLKKYGVAHHTRSLEVKHKTQCTCLKKYGVKHVFSSKEIRQKIKKTIIERYKVDNAIKSEVVQQKIRSTCLKRYGVSHASRSKITRERTRRTLRRKFLTVYNKNLSIKNIECLSDKNAYLNLEPLIFRCVVCGTIWIYSSTNATLNDVECPHCIHLKSYKGRSRLEHDIFNYISSIYHGKILRDTRKVISPYELDIYLPDLKIAFEINGSFWHSENNGTNREYQFNKSKRCINNGVKLFHIYEYDWLIDADKVKTLIKRAIFGAINVSISTCSFELLSEDIYHKFIENNSNAINKHSSRYTSYFGLVYDKEIIFAANYRYVNSILEIYQYCYNCKYNISIFSIISKIAKKQKIDGVIIHEDLDYPLNLTNFLQRTNKKSYSSPKYIFVNRAEKIDKRLFLNKKLLAKTLCNYDYTKTAYKNLENNRYYKIYNAGYLKVTFYGNLSK